jgi:uncharacterized membrane protein YeiH
MGCPASWRHHACNATLTGLTWRHHAGSYSGVVRSVMRQYGKMLLHTTVYSSAAAAAAFSYSD